MILKFSDPNFIHTSIGIKTGHITPNGDSSTIPVEKDLQKKENSSIFCKESMIDSSTPVVRTPLNFLPPADKLDTNGPNESAYSPPLLVRRDSFRLTFQPQGRISSALGK